MNPRSLILWNRNRGEVSASNERATPFASLHRELDRMFDNFLRGFGDLDVPRVSLADAVRAMIRVTTESPDGVLDRLRRDRDQ